MKRIALLLIMAVMVAGATFALDLSAGGGLLIVPQFANRSYDGEKTGSTDGVNIGANLFFDATYVEVNLGLLFGNFKDKDKDGKVEDGDKGTDTTNLTIGLVGKYPIAIADKVKLFPFVGFEYNLLLAAKYDGEDLIAANDDKWGKDKNGNDYTRADVNSSLKLLLGVGVDFDLTDSLYFRGEVGYGIDFLSKAYNDKIKDDSKNNIVAGIVPIKLAVGFRF